MKKKYLFILFLLVTNITFAQKKYTTKSGQIKFFSNTALEDVEATNNQVFCSLNSSTNKIQFAVLIKGFAFENSLMQKHFNEAEYMYSDKYPKAIFNGTIKNKASINFNKAGSYKAFVEGSLSMHGITKLITTEGTITITTNKIILNSKFNISPTDYKIAVPEGISNTIAVKVDCKLD